jgi:hypothetical protein
MRTLPERIEHMAGLLEQALQHPLTGEAWPGLVATAMGLFGDVPLLHAFAEKAVETLEDYERHDRLAVSPGEPRVAVWFVAWSGTHREVQTERYGEYFGVLASTAYRIVQRGAELAGFLEIDAYIRGEAAAEGSSDALIEVDVELSFLPGLALQYPPEKPNPLPPIFHVNQELCTPEEMAQLRQAIG